MITVKSLPSTVPVQTQPDPENHPRFSLQAGLSLGCIHSAAAPPCNIQCWHCNRQYSCVNESCPGVTARVIRPNRALDFRCIKVNTVCISGINDDNVTGISRFVADPGDCCPNIIPLWPVVGRPIPEDH